MNRLTALTAASVVLLALSALVYWDAKRRGSRYAHLYGLAMIPANAFGPLGFLLYLYYRDRIGEESPATNPRNTEV